MRTDGESKRGLAYADEQTRERVAEPVGKHHTKKGIFKQQMKQRGKE
jgi:hypothetical protein